MPSILCFLVASILSVGHASDFLDRHFESTPYGHSCSAGFNPIASSSECSNAARALQLTFGGNRSDDSAPWSCFRLSQPGDANDGHVYWNSWAGPGFSRMGLDFDFDFDEVLPLTARVCGTDGDFPLMPLSKSGCRSGLDFIGTETKCSIAALQLKLPYLGEIPRTVDGAIRGCMYGAGSSNLGASALIWWSPEKTYRDSGLICEKSEEASSVHLAAVSV